MDELFAQILEISWQSALIALAVIIVRFFLKKRASKRSICLLWLLVALRLLLPASLLPESPVSLQQPESPPAQVYHDLRQQQETYLSAPPEQRPAMVQTVAAQRFALLDQLPAIWLGGVHAAVHGGQPAASALASPPRPPCGRQCLPLH